MKHILMLCATVICFIACKKNLEEEFVNKINDEGILSAKLSPVPNPVPPYQWASLPVPAMISYPWNGPSTNNLIIPVGNDIYLLTGSLLGVYYRLNNQTKKWETYSPTFGLFGVGYQHLFSYQGKIYSGMMPGVDFKETFFYSIDPVTGASNTLATFPGIPTYQPITFVLGDKGYLISGYNNTTTSRVWEYNFATNVWSNKGNSPLGKRTGGIAMVANGKVFMGLGYENTTFNGQTIRRYKKDWLQYTPGSAYSAIKADFPGQARSEAKGFVVNNSPHLGFGKSGSTYYKDFWKYNPSSNTWTQQPNWPGITSTDDNNIGSFSLGTTGYVVKGALAEFWRYSNSIFYP